MYRASLHDLTSCELLLTAPETSGHRELALAYCWSAYSEEHLSWASEASETPSDQNFMPERMSVSLIMGPQKGPHQKESSSSGFRDWATKAGDICPTRHP